MSEIVVDPVLIPVDAQVVLDGLRFRGLTVRLEGERLLVRPAELLDDVLRVAIAQHKVALVALLDVEELETHCVELWTAKQAAFGDTPPDDPRAEARAASETCLAAHRRYMGALDALERMCV